MLSTATLVVMFHDCPMCHADKGQTLLFYLLWLHAKSKFNILHRVGRLCSFFAAKNSPLFGINCWFTGSNQEKLCRTRQSLHFTPYLCARYEKFGRRF